MFDQLKNEFMMLLVEDGFQMEDINKIINSLTIVSNNYDITLRETSIVPYTEDHLPRLAKYYLLDLASQNYSKSTLVNIKSTLQNFFSYTGKTIEEITASDIKVYILTYNRESNRNIKTCTLEKYRQYICGLFKWLYNNEYIDKDITKNYKAIKYEKNKRTALSKEQFCYFKDSCVSLKEKAMIEVLYSTGIRVGELCTIKLDDIDMREKTINIYGEKSKKYRTVYLSSSAVVAINNYMTSKERKDSEYLFHLERSSIRPYPKMEVTDARRVVANISNRAYKYTNIKVTPHIIRHTFATHAVQNGMPIEVLSKILGHCNLHTTMVYVDLDDSEVKHLHEKVVL